MISKNRALFLEFSIYTIAFAASISLFPICYLFYLGEHESINVEPQYLSDFGIAYVFPLYYSMSLVAFLSLKKGLVIAINILVLVLTILTFFLLEIGFAWWGASPYHPEFGVGYWFSQLFIVVLAIRSFTSLHRLKAIKINRKISLIFMILSILIPIGFFVFLYLFNQKQNELPRSISNYKHVEKDRLIGEDSWYYPVYNAYVDKYFSIDTLGREKCRLDSMRFRFFDEHHEILKDFTKRVMTDAPNIEKVLEANDPL